jgi:hypothetical protein
MPKTPYPATLLRVCGIGLLVFAGLQFVRPKLKNPPVSAELQAPPEIKDIFRHSCYSCHSNETKLLWLDRVVPAYWIVSKDVHQARTHLNFSEVGALPGTQQKLILFDAFNQIQLGAMPLPRYRAVHPDSAVTAEQLAILRNYLTPKSQEPPATLLEVHAAEREYVSWINRNGTVRTVQNTLAGVPFHPEYKMWRLIGSTERIENSTIRVVLGNDLAMKAIAENHINPWPDGAIIAKVTWHEQPDSQGEVQPGQFVQVELMIRDREKYHTTAGWGWGRWIGTGLEPDGHTLDFANRQCVNCHLAVRRNDYVFTMPIKHQPRGAK